MASELSDYLANAVLNWTKGTAMPAAPATVYLALFDGDPTATGTGGTEVTTTIRAAGRPAIPFGVVSGRSMSNSADVDFGNSAGAANVTHAALFDAASGGNMLTYSPLDNVRSIVANDPVVIPTGDTIFNFN